MGEWDIEFKRRQDAAYQKAKAQQQELIEQAELLARAAAAAAKLRAAQSAEPKAKAKRRKKSADAFERTKQAIKAKCNGALVLSKSARSNLSKALGVSDSTIARALKELRDEQSNYVK